MKPGHTGYRGSLSHKCFLKHLPAPGKTAWSLVSHHYDSRRVLKQHAVPPGCGQSTQALPADKLLLHHLTGKWRWELGVESLHLTPLRWQQVASPQVKPAHRDCSAAGSDSMSPLRSRAHHDLHRPTGLGQAGHGQAWLSTQTLAFSRLPVTFRNTCGMKDC